MGLSRKFLPAPFHHGGLTSFSTRCPVAVGMLKVRVAIGTALPGIFIPAIQRRPVGRSLVRRRLGAVWLPTACGISDQADALRLIHAQSAQRRACPPGMFWDFSSIAVA